MAGIEKMHSLTLALREVIYRFDSHLDEDLDTPELREHLKDLKDFLWELKPFWEAVGVAESYAFTCEDEPLEKRVEILESSCSYLAHRVDRLVEESEKQ